MITKILVPLDESPLAEKALPFAISLAQRTGAHLVLAEIVEPNMFMDGSGSGQDADIVAAAHTYIEHMNQTVTDPASTDHLAEQAVTGLVRQGPRTEALLGAIAAENVDLVVMTSHARSGISRLALGSTAMAIVHRAPVPVIVLHPDSNAPSVQIGNGPILVTLDGTARSEAILDPAIALATVLGMSISLLQVVVPVVPSYLYGEAGAYIFEDPTRVTEEARQTAIVYLNTIRRRVKSRGVGCSTTVKVAADTIDEIARVAHETNASIVAMATHARERLGEVVLGSVADAVLRNVSEPVMLVHLPGHTATASTQTAAIATR